MSDSFTNTMGPSGLYTQESQFATYASYRKREERKELRIRIKSSRLHSVRYILDIDITSASAYKNKIWGKSTCFVGGEGGCQIHT